jgi:hypothetical protein
VSAITMRTAAQGKFGSQPLPGQDNDSRGWVVEERLQGHGGPGKSASRPGKLQHVVAQLIEPDL